MTKFNPDKKSELSYQETLGPAMKITDQSDADQYFRAYVAFIKNQIKKEKSSGDAVQIAKSNLAYYAAYFGDETRRQVEKLFHCAHPVFGGIASSGAPTANEAFQIGLDRGNLSKWKEEFGERV